ncbi:hypothetical protein [Mesorhizobium sp.]|uniref:hypothetical protein n=1 Tax=Mesorhizobium sp. TaxID=1871066 RepID=UPI000FE6C72F|nr:hypothetical protein [Mesorhizobium sp.]RWP52915.1 MAG: hypothetical protein EOR06_18110 [Mesorhizobium sp.]
MSIRDEIANRVDEGRLFVLTPSLNGMRTVRHMFVSPELMAVVDPGSWGHDAKTDRFARLRADLDYFVENGRIAISEDPYKKPKSTYLARTDPIRDEVWDIRSRDPKPGIRVLGSFSEQNTFIALAWAYREQLNGPGSKEWRDFIQTAKARWRGLFGTYQPHTGSQVSDYVSEKFQIV